MSKESSPKIKTFRVRAVRVPMAEPHRTASGVITDPDGSELTYRISVFQQNPAIIFDTAPVVTLDGLVEDDGLAVGEVTPEDGLLDNTRYYWRGWANNGLVFGPPSGKFEKWTGS